MNAVVIFLEGDELPTVPGTYIHKWDSETVEEWLERARLLYLSRN